MIVGKGRLAQQGLGDRRGQPLGRRLQFPFAGQGPLPRQNHHPLAGIENVRRRAQLRRAWRYRGTGEHVGHVVFDIALRRLVGLDRLGLMVDGDGHMHRLATGHGGAASQLDDVFHVSRTHDALAEGGGVSEQPVQGHILLGEGADQVVELQAGDGDDRLAVKLGVVQAVQQVNAARSRRGYTAAELARELGVGARHEGRCLLVTHLDESDLFLALAQGFDDAVYAIARDAEYRIHPPLVQGFNEHVRRGHGHGGIPSGKGVR